MYALGLGTVWWGYSLFYYGFTQVRGGNWGYADLTLPSRAATLASIPPDGMDAQTNLQRAEAAFAASGTLAGTISGLFKLAWKGGTWVVTHVGGKH